MKTNFPPSDTASPALLSISKGNTLEDVDETRLPYTWLSNLGSGACGIVEEVEDINTGAVYARKLLRLKSWNKRSMKELFENEIEIIKSLGEHHHLIQVFATYTTKDKLGLILTPVAEDGDLHEFLAKFQELNSSDTSESTTKENMRLTLTRGFGCLAGGLSYMHERRIRHKDIKAQNILIHQGKVIYTDFGLSFDSNLLENSTTDDLASMTRRYAAPEVIQNRPRNSSSDVFALGCVFLEIYSALTAGVQFLQQGEYSEAMPKIHTLLLSTYSPIELHPIFEFIVSMTSDIPEARPSAKLIGSSLLRRLEFCCPQCYSECTIAGADESQSQSLPPASSPTSTISSLSRIDDTGRIDDTQRIEDTQRMYKPTNTPSYASPARMSFRARVLSKLAVRSPPQSTNDPLGLIVIHQPNSPPALDIIFVHGMGGTSRATWSKDRDPEYFWPGKWLPFEPEMASARILSFGYNATFAASGPAVVTGIADVAGDLLFEMQFAKRRLDLGKRPIIFIAHSTGGLVVKQTYMFCRNDPSRYSELVSSISGILFLATPHHASEFAEHRASDFAELLHHILIVSISDNKVYAEDVYRGAFMIKTLTEQFSDVAGTLDISSYYETLPTRTCGSRKKSIVVKKDFAILGLPGENAQAFNADHNSICKFENVNDPNYLSIRLRLKTMIRDIEGRGTRVSFRVGPEVNHDEENGVRPGEARLDMDSKKWHRG